ncbi:venom phosphodiesterase CdcPDE [Conger conger]|uniref:venom phosphodiesterase CdcPDE n=1 Tax=Conger conger TaxID=82655 RepID=UPI002A5983A4|nr:venom phosphodiesterase CdcPDE [Conger conger]
MGFGKDMSRNNLILIGLLAVCIVALILGLALGLGQDNCNKDIPISCRQRCYEPHDNEYPGCRCDALCVETKSCCYDFQDSCIQPTEQWECTKLRCGEKRMSNSKCHCSDDCLGAGDCCTNFNSVCQGKRQWVQDTCEEIAVPICPKGFSKVPLLLISLDGFRAEYLSTWSQLVPVLDKLKNCGTHAPYMQAVFPSLTFPNHYTIVTGLYSESHGLVANSMYDPVFNASFSLSNSEKAKPRWYQGQPIWLTAMYQGLKSGTFFWPGSDVKINGSFPDLYMDYNGKTPFEERVFAVLKWLKLPEEERPDFFTLYLEEPDKSGHNSGPVSGRVILAIQEVDRIIGQLMDGLKQMGLHRCINIVIVADHGMEDTSCERVEYLQSMIDNVKDLYVYEGAFGRIRSRDTHVELDSAGLVANMTCKKPDQQIKPYLKPHLPKRFHYAVNRRIEDVSVLVNAKWLFARYPGTISYCAGGTHGYDNDIESMQAMFLGFGPKFHYKKQVDPFGNIELYNLMCDVLEITPAPNNGSHGSLNHLLRKPWHKPSFPEEITAPGWCLVVTLVSADPLGCSCTGQTEADLNSRLNLTSQEALASIRKHMQFGQPKMLRSGEDYCLLYQHGYINAYSNSSLMPTWSSYTVDKPGSVTPLPEVISSCLRPDVRISGGSSPRCDQYAAGGNITPAFLYPPNLNESDIEQYDGLLMSNVVPMYPEFKKIWDYFHTVLLMKYAWQYNGVNVVSGPVFDYNYDGIFDTPEQIEQFVTGTVIPVPTHYFVVLSSCKNTSFPVGDCREAMQTVSFLLPHRPTNSEVCNSHEAESQWVEDLMWFHQSRVRDVELVTGLDFYQGSNRPIPELLQLKARPTSAIHRMN